MLQQVISRVYAIHSYSGVNLPNPPLRLGSCLYKALAVVLEWKTDFIAVCILHDPNLWKVLSHHIVRYDLTLT